MEVFFLDVAQGTCQILLLGDRRAIVIDCGMSSDRLALRFLQRMGVEYIERLIVSHSHDDHIGGAVSILGEYQDRIATICFVQDHKFRESAFWARISELLESGKLSKDQLIRLEATGCPQLIWANDSETSRLRTFSPSAGENLLAQDAATPNATSAVLFLDINKNRVVFAADSEVAQWREIHRKSKQRMTCDVLAVPHHAGQVHSSSEELSWLFDEALSTDVAVVSVGTSNTHGHPRQDVIAAMTARGTKVLCTQITRRCHRDLEALRPGVLQSRTYLGGSSPRRDLTQSGNSRNVACAGTVRVAITAHGLNVDRLNEHQQAVDRLAQLTTDCPLCRIHRSMS